MFALQHCVTLLIMYLGEEGSRDRVPVADASLLHFIFSFCCHLITGSLRHPLSCVSNVFSPAASPGCAKASPAGLLFAVVPPSPPSLLC